MKINWKRAVNTELRVASIIQKQRKTGVLFDKEKAKEYINNINEIQEEIYNQIRPYFTHDLDIKEVKKDGNYLYVKKVFLINGNYSASVCNHFHNDPACGLDTDRLVDGPFSRIEWIEPDFNKRRNVAKQLLMYGWKPEFYTETGQPKITNKGQPVPSLERMEHPFGKLLAKWYTYEHRKNTIIGWLRDLRKDGRLTADADTVGTPTARFRHKVVVNVPKAKDSIIFGKEMRGLFIAPPDGYICGYDAKGLEARMEAHYTYPYDNGEYAKEILEGDVHTKNQQWISEIVPIDRDMAKNIKYALTYGAQIKKIKNMLECSMKEAERIFTLYWENNNALGQLRKRIMRMLKVRDWLPGLDGRKIYVMSDHSALNYLFQSGGAIAMKNAMVLLDDAVQKDNLPARKIIDMHDEGQWEVHKDIVIRANEDLQHHILTKDKQYYCPVGELAVKSVVQSGIDLELRCPLDAEYIIGNSWAETH